MTTFRVSACPKIGHWTNRAYVSKANFAALEKDYIRAGGKIAGNENSLNLNVGPWVFLTR
jgi:hypothetical protein